MPSKQKERGALSSLSGELAFRQQESIRRSLRLPAAPENEAPAERWRFSNARGAGQDPMPCGRHSTRKAMPFCSQYAFAQLSGPQRITRSFGQYSKA